MNQRFRQIALCTFCLIACDVQIIIEVGGYRHIDCGFVSSFYREDAIGTSYFPSLVADGQPSLKFYFSLQSFMQGRHPWKDYAVSFFRVNHYILMRGGELCVEGNLSRTVGSQSYHNYLIGKWGDRFTLILHSVYFITDDGTCRVQTQFPIIIGIAGMSGEGNSQVAETLIRHSRICFCHHFLRSERLCFQIFSGKNKFTYLRNILQCVRVCVVVGASCPNGFFV